MPTDAVPPVRTACCAAWGSHCWRYEYPEPTIAIVGMRARQLGGRSDHAGRSDQRILGRGVAVGGREERGSLDVRVVVGAPGGDARETDAELAAQLEEAVGLREIDAATGLVATERVASDLGCLGYRRADTVRVGLVGHEVVRRQSHTDREVRDARPDAIDHASEERGPVLERPAEGARSIDRPEQLVEQVPVAVLHVDEVEARVRGERGRVDVGRARARRGRRPRARRSPRLPPGGRARGGGMRSVAATRRSAGTNARSA